MEIAIKMVPIFSKLFYDSIFEPGTMDAYRFFCGTLSLRNCNRR